MTMTDTTTRLAQLLEAMIEPGDRWGAVVAITETYRDEVGFNLDYAAYGVAWAIESARVDGYTAKALERMDATERVMLLESLCGLVMADVPAALQRYIDDAR